MIKKLVENPSHFPVWCHKNQVISKQGKVLIWIWIIVTNVLLLLTIIDLYGLDKSDYQMDHKISNMQLLSLYLFIGYNL